MVDFIYYVTKNFQACLLKNMFLYNLTAKMYVFGRNVITTGLLFLLT